MEEILMATIQKPPSQKRGLEFQKRLADYIRTHGPVAQEDICRELKVTRQTLTRHLPHLDGVVVRTVGKTKRYELAPRGQTLFDHRLQECTEQKQAIARMIREILLGTGEHAAPPLSFEERYEPIVVHFRDGRLRELLLSIAHQPARSITLDGGSTNFIVARDGLCPMSLPNRTCELLSLKVLTNCPPIAEELYRRTTGMSVVLVGGNVCCDRRFISGMLAERAIDCWSVVTDLAFIGAQGVDRWRGFFIDYEDEATIKQMLLSRAKVRCIIMNSSKAADYESKVAVGFYPFAPVSRNCVDIVVSDPGIKRYPGFCSRLRQEGIELIADR